MLYPGVGLLEMTNISVGRGTDRPLSVDRCTVDGRPGVIRLAQRTATARVVTLPRKITPDASKHSGVECSGVQFVITDTTQFDALKLGLAIARGLHALHKDAWDSSKLDVLVVNKPWLTRWPAVLATTK